MAGCPKYASGVLINEYNKAEMLCFKQRQKYSYCKCKVCLSELGRN